jgi:ADP-ribose pyrophosphatase
MDADSGMAEELKVRILESHEDYRYGNRFRVLRARLQYRRFDGQLSDPVTRISFERGDSVGVLLYDARRDVVILASQFRYPVFARQGSGGPPEAAQSAWLLEVVAGMQDPGYGPQEVAHQELLEEAGYELKSELRSIASFYPSPGGSSERITLFWAEVDGGPRSGTSGGVLAEGEDIQMVALPLTEAMQKIANGEICDAKTIIALQHLALTRGVRNKSERPAHPIAPASL